ncbi:RecQ-mediated genome instability protein [Lachnellula subtilissima]|uniref:RecQ-mediated genome instability protein 1 n=1 Tax=Lachnellula subtilissima TaxID=602034 RepID=A0A8H8RGN4_9HELO|nr:RecQ-mediated genome instability protein [Lachnellula subtilissima]
MASPITPTQLSNALTQSGLPTPHPSFLTPILNTASNSQRQPPLSSLSATARLRLLSADISTPSILAPINGSFPQNISDVRVKEKVLGQDIPVQVIDIEDIGRSKWDQILDLEAERKGERVKGREVIRVLPTQENELGSTASTQAIANPTAANAAVSNKGPFKVLLQDMNGQQVYGFEVKRVDKLGYPPGMNIGCKVMLKKGCKVARGMMLLEPACVVVLGGKIEALDKGWREGREERLRMDVKKTEAPGRANV